MFDVALKSVITFLVIYFIIETGIKLVKFFLSEKERKDIFVFIHVKNQENNIEYIVRCTILNYLHKYGGRTVPYIVIVDKGSEDNTYEIAKKLCHDYDFLYYTTSDEYENFKNELNGRG